MYIQLFQYIPYCCTIIPIYIYIYIDIFIQYCYYNYSNIYIHNIVITIIPICIYNIVITIITIQIPFCTQLITKRHPDKIFVTGRLNSVKVTLSPHNTDGMFCVFE